MKIIVEIPDEFISHFEADRFDESFGRILADISYFDGISGRYERETIEMLRVAFRNAKVRRWRADDGHKTRIYELKNELAELNTRYDIELAHMRADGILCEIITLCGLSYVVDEWRKVAKWYA